MFQKICLYRLVPVVRTPIQIPIASIIWYLHYQTKENIKFVVSVDLKLSLNIVFVGLRSWHNKFPLNELFSQFLLPWNWLYHELCLVAYQASQRYVVQWVWTSRNNLWLSSKLLLFCDLIIIIYNIPTIYLIWNSVCLYRIDFKAKVLNYG